jgi:hypothetical protein
MSHPVCPAVLACFSDLTVPLCLLRRLSGHFPCVQSRRASSPIIFLDRMTQTRQACGAGRQRAVERSP